MIKTMRSNNDCGQSDYEKEQQGKFSQIVTRIVIMIVTSRANSHSSSAHFQSDLILQRDRDREKEKLQRKKEKARVM